MSASERSVVWAADRPVPVGVTEAVEEWRPIPGFGMYEVSNLGRVLSHCRNKPRIKSPVINARGYQSVGLVDDEGVPRTTQVHRLVLTAFVGACPPGLEGCHADGNRLNNTLSNLRWDSRSENTRDQVRLGRHNNARKTHCKRGHALDGPDATVLPNGHRYCVTCSRAAARARYARSGSRSASAVTSTRQTSVAS